MKLEFYLQPRLSSSAQALLDKHSTLSCFEILSSFFRREKVDFHHRRHTREKSRWKNTWNSNSHCWVAKGEQRRKKILDRTFQLLLLIMPKVRTKWRGKEHIIEIKIKLSWKHFFLSASSSRAWRPWRDILKFRVRNYWSETRSSSD